MFLKLGLLLAAFSARAETLHVLTYGSMVAKGSWGNYVRSEFEKTCNGCRVKWVTGNESSGLLGMLRSDRRRGRTSRYDLVLGLEETQYQIALKDKLVTEGRAFNSSPFALMADTRAFPRSEWPRTWKDLGSKAKNKILIQDPRLSGPGVGWLRAIFSDQLISLEVSRDLVFAVFPSWSASYQAFLSQKAPLVWTFLGSEAYHLCHGDGERYRAIPLEEGYPVYVERVAWASSVKSPLSSRFVEFVLSEGAQKKIPELNWMFPVRKDVALPDCFSGVTKIKSLSSSISVDSKELQRWMDIWSNK